jgi:hypothetical protein
VTFNGFDPFGQTPNAGGALAAVDNGALASQAVGPANNPVEMSCAGRFFNGPGGLGTKMLARPPLQFQQVAITDSVLGGLANPDGPGLQCGGAPCSYGDLIAAAFGDPLAGTAEASFSVIWGEALAAYEATLIPDQTSSSPGRTSTTAARRRWPTSSRSTPAAATSPTRSARATCSRARSTPAIRPRWSSS